MEQLSKKDFESDQEVRWCPGCGDYAVLATMQRILPTLNIPKEKIVFVSGIGCAGRFPYYMNTYGFHTIHGRAFSVALGLKLSRPDLTVFVITGDGDGLSIGLHHLMHLMRKNLDLNILLFNNRIYGLTKGQYSPASEYGKVTKSSPFGSKDKPLNPIKVALAADCSFIARGIDIDAPGLGNIITKAVRHKGTSFIEIFQNCNVFNDGAFKDFAAKNVRAENTIWLENNKLLVFGNNKDKALILDDFNLKQIKLSNNDKVLNSNNKIEAKYVLRPVVYNTTNTMLANLLADIYAPDFPVPIGIFREITDKNDSDNVDANKNLEDKNDKAAKNIKDIKDLITKGGVWQV